MELWEHLGFVYYKFQCIFLYFLFLLTLYILLYLIEHHFYKKNHCLGIGCLVSF
jgi:hypothetical protein